VFVREHEPSSAATATAAAPDAADGTLIVGGAGASASAAVPTPNLFAAAGVAKPCCGMLAHYLAASPEAAELFTLWDRAGAAATNRLATAVMRCVACVVRYGPPGTRVALARRVLRTRSKSLLSAVAGANPSATAAAQDLAVAVVRQGPHLAREFVARFNLAFKPLAAHTAAGAVVSSEFGPLRLRSGNVALVTALLECGAPDVVQEVVATKGTLFSVLKGLGGDGDGLVGRVLEVVRGSVLANARVPRKLKVDVFSGAVVQVRVSPHARS
jgi:hypothetical protein